MVQPINYMLDVVNPIQSTLQGFNGGFQLGAAYADRQRAIKQAEQDQLIKQQMSTDLMNLANNPTPEGYSKVMTMYPQLSENLKRAYDTMDDGQRKNTLSLASQSYAALANNQPEIAKQVLGDAATAYENSGNKKDAGVLRGYIKMIENNPSAARTSIGMLMASTDPDKFKDIYSTLGQEQRANEMQPYEIAESKAKTGLTNAQAQGQVINNQYAPAEKQSNINQTQSQTALNYANIQNMAERLNLDRDKLETETSLKLQELNPSNIKLSDGAQKIVNDNMIESVALEQSANRMNDLADRFEKESQAGGIYTKGWVGFKRITGWSNDDQNAMIREYTRLRNSEAIKSLPPGPATDKDIELALKGLPPETADSTTITSFLRGYAKLNQRDAAYKQMQAEWVNQVGNMGSTKRDVEVLGVKVPAGTTFNGYATKNIGKALKHQANQAVDRQIATGTRSYMSAVQ
ncbi:hypothetical protein P5778_003825 [Acinetobacter baumannii]|uniref:hypothetical protein n=1 Tax=Acinetobacter baumannii TaxID=470 RepID=UPI001D0F31D4|nr:hypothetical protein [Acinetobacter baumannii]